MNALIDRLSQLGLIKASFDRASASQLRTAPHSELLALCEAGALEGGISAALDVRPDELIGPLTAAMGGVARELRVVEVRDRPRYKMNVRVREKEQSWILPSLNSLVAHLNELCKIEPSTKAVAVLGDWEDALQLWAVELKLLPQLLREKFFRPRNRRHLSALAQTPTES